MLCIFSSKSSRRMPSRRSRFTAYSALEANMKKIAAISTIALAMGMGSALAADLPSRKAPVYVPPPPPLTWNGFYAGLNIGGGWNANNPNNEVSAYWDPRLGFGSSAFVPGQGFVPNLFFLPNGNQT